MSVSKYAYAYARIRARMSDILSEGRLREFIDAKNKDDFLSSLTDTLYGERIAKAASTDIRSIEGALKEEIIEQYLMVIRSTKGKIRDVFEEFFRRLEVENLKSVIT